MKSMTKTMTITGAVMATALWITGPTFAQQSGTPYMNDEAPAAPGAEMAPESAPESTPESAPEAVVPAPEQAAPDSMTGETQETIVPGSDAGAQDEAAPQGRSTTPMEPEGSKSPGEFGSPAESGPSLDSEVDEAGK